MPTCSLAEDDGVAEGTTPANVICRYFLILSERVVDNNITGEVQRCCLVSLKWNRQLITTICVQTNAVVECNVDRIRQRHL